MPFLSKLIAADAAAGSAVQSGKAQTVQYGWSGSRLRCRRDVDATVYTIKRAVFSRWLVDATVHMADLMVMGPASIVSDAYAVNVISQPRGGISLWDVRNIEARQVVCYTAHLNRILDSAQRSTNGKIANKQSGLGANGATSLPQQLIITLAPANTFLLPVHHWRTCLCPPLLSLSFFFYPLLHTRIIMSHRVWFITPFITFWHSGTFLIILLSLLSSPSLSDLCCCEINQ